jgi:hypothetical protein
VGDACAEVRAPDDELTTSKLCGQADDQGAKHVCAGRSVTVGLEEACESSSSMAAQAPATARKCCAATSES